VVYEAPSFQNQYFFKNNNAMLLFSILLHEAGKNLDKRLVNQEKVLDAVNNLKSTNEI